MLVALWPRPQDHELAAERGWYRVRPGAAIDRMGDLGRFRSLAFYQPDSFGTDRRQIQYRAKISGYERLTRAQLLPDQPDHRRSQELYHCFRLGPLEKLRRPIPSRRGRRLLFIPTTEFRLETAQEINDLFAGTPIEDRLFSALKRAGLWPEREYFVELARLEAPRSRPAAHFLDLALFCRERSLDVECDGDTWHIGRESAERDRGRDNLLEANGWHILRFNTTEIDSRMEDVLIRVRQAINQYGGIMDDTGAVRRFLRDGTLGPGQPALDLYAQGDE